MNMPALIGVGVFYFIIILVGLLAVCRKRWKYDCENEDILGGRSIGFFLGTISLTATFVGGAYINETIVMVYEKGIVHTQIPWGCAFSLTIGGLIFAKKMRKDGHTTMLDPLQERYGTVMCVILSIPALVGELFWSAAILSSLGAILNQVLGMKFEYGIVISVFVATFYTVLGGLYAVVYTDVLQLLCIFFGLWIVVPFAMMHENVDMIASHSQVVWTGIVKGYTVGSWLDRALLLVFGGISRQIYFQRVLAAKSGTYARVISLASALGCVIVAVPAVMIGITVRSTDWESVLPVNDTIIMKNGDIRDPSRHVLLLVLQYLTPYWVSIVALGAICAAVMSSIDSSILSSSSMFSHNIYRVLVRRTASAKEVAWITRVGVLIAGISSGVVAIKMKSLNNYWILSCDFVYVILFPQLLCAVFLKFVTLYGSIPAFIIAILLRLGGGEKDFGLPVFIKYPFFDDVEEIQLFPFRTFAMGASILTLIIFSSLVEWWRPTRKKMVTPQEEINVLEISYKEPKTETALSFSKISRLSGSYNNIAANAAEICRIDDDKSFLRTPVSRGESKSGPAIPDS